MAPPTGIDLVTGGAGFIASHLVDGLLAQGRAVRVFDSFVVGRCANPQHHKEQSSLIIIEGDVADGAGGGCGHRWRSVPNDLASILFAIAPPGI